MDLTTFIGTALKVGSLFEPALIPVAAAFSTGAPAIDEIEKFLASPAGKQVEGNIESALAKFGTSLSDANIGLQNAHNHLTEQEQVMYDKTDEGY